MQERGEGKGERGAAREERGERGGWGARGERRKREETRGWGVLRNASRVESVCIVRGADFCGRTCWEPKSSPQLRHMREDRSCMPVDSRPRGAAPYPSMRG
jgi:hypothetical protein